MNSRTREELKQQKRIFEIMGFNYIDFNDKRIINYVAKSLMNVETGAYVCMGTVSYESALAGGLENLKVLGTLFLSYIIIGGFAYIMMLLNSLFTFF